MIPKLVSLTITVPVTDNIALVIHSLLDDLTVGVCSCAVAWVVNIVDSISSAGGKQDPVSTVVHIGDDPVSLGESIADFTLTGLLNALEGRDTKSIDTGPDNVATICITTISSQPVVK